MPKRWFGNGPIHRARQRKRARRRKIMSVAHPISRRVTKGADISDFGGNTLSALNTHQDLTLYSWNLDLIPKEEDKHSYIERETDVINMKGWRLHMVFKNTNNAPIKINCAIVAIEKHDEDAATSNTDEWWRDYTSSQRTKNFATTDEAPVYNSYRINPEKFKVIHRWSRTLESTDSPDEKRKHWVFNKYVPFKRQFIYDTTEATDGSDTPHNLTIRFFFWGCGLMQAAGGTPANKFMCQGSIIAFWRDVRSY